MTRSKKSLPVACPVVPDSILLSRSLELLSLSVSVCDHALNYCGLLPKDKIIFSRYLDAVDVYMKARGV